MKDYVLIPDDLFERKQFMLLDADEKDKLIVFWLRLYTIALPAADGSLCIRVYGLDLTDNMIGKLTNKANSTRFIHAALSKLIDIGVIRRESNSLIIIPPWESPVDCEDDK